MKKVAAVVVLYNPDEDVIGNIETYLNQVDKLFVVDNSDVVDSSLAEKIKLMGNAEYICNKSNIGIAAALNVGAKKALNDGFKYLLTMDQDSRASSQMVENLYGVMQSVNNAGILTAAHVNTGYQDEPGEKVTEEILYTMTNGNLLNLSSYQKVGEFLEELFIDHVDHEYCLRLKKNDFKVLKTSKAIVYHKLGEETKKKLFFFHLYPTNHSPIRLYYRTRNRFYVDRIYKKIFPEYVREDRKHMLREMLEIFLYDDDLWKKVKMMFKGYLDYRKNNMGRYFNEPGKKF